MGQLDVMKMTVAQLSVRVSAGHCMKSIQFRDAALRRLDEARRIRGRGGCPIGFEPREVRASPAKGRWRRSELSDNRPLVR